ncbi:carbohydrate kinase [Flavilitoribacter nigricans DSM 23189 = NBRC 102662]|uniref:Carbohydrate kinase n=1 Tax=Flavilitoribacter nigricans (strain ATCC 23147 / DSM 23189 / NBRC 102662 / NCIMB 1420 / SS-2) TaxID=1122177 RepID=A0A2D0N6J5_FLAN2|nr:FGGY family carbohydrate kinase [Flavilitoribacter nigricans]PHN04010.1 carbohydrate kinase [Flavilitoribacter nigricans DSM 23189 = NBRC 102662]
MYLLGFDIGSSTIKAALIDADSRTTVGVVQFPETEMDLISRQSGWAEQHPEVWWQNLCLATRRLLFKYNVDPESVKAIGLGYQMHGLVLVDRDQHVLRPSIIWCDSRAVPIGQQAFKELGEQYCLEHLLNSPGNFTASRLKWVKDNEPEIYEKIHRVIVPGDYLAMRMTGELTTTVSGLSEGIFWDFRENKVADPLLEYFGIDPGLLPPVVPTFSLQGELTRMAAESMGLKVGTPVTYRAGDQPNNALALNVLHPGEIAATSGTSGVVYGIVDEARYDNLSRVNAFAHVNHGADQQRIGVLLCINGAGIQYGWMKHQVARSGTTYEDMERMASTVPVGSDGLCLLPFGNGAERMLGNRNLNAHLFNLQLNRHTRAHTFRAALEGVAFSFVYGINILKEMGLQVSVMRVGNDNMFRSGIFGATIASLLDCKIEVMDSTGAIGAARAAGYGAGIYNSLEEALSGLTVEAVHEPTLNPALCRQAYSYWQSCLDRILNEHPRSRNAPVDQVRDDLPGRLKRKEKELNTASLKLSTADQLLGDVRDYLKKQTTEKEQGDPSARNLYRKIDHFLHDQESWDLLEQRIDLMQDDFHHKLRKTCPELSLEDIHLCNLIRTNLSTKELANILNLSVRGVETRRYRLRKKLDLPREEGLVEYLEGL